MSRFLAASLPQEPTATKPLLAVFEVLSPEDYHLRLMRKLVDYERVGIPAIYVVDPQTGVFERFVDGLLKQQGTFSLAEVEIMFSFSKIARVVC